MYLMECSCVGDDDVADGVDVEMEETLLEDVTICNVLLRLLSNKQCVLLVTDDDKSLPNNDRV